MYATGSKLLSYLFVILTLFSLSACGGSSSSSQGQLALSLTDATLHQYQAVYVTIDNVSVHLEDTDEWLVVASPTPMKTFNLLELVNGVMLDLGLADMDPGHYTQLRLMIGSTADDGQNIFGNDHPYANYIIDENGDSHELKIPSGMQSGVKLVKGFDINAGELTELILDFDAAKSVVKAGKSGKWLLKPTIKVLDTRLYAVINGNVTDEDTEPLEDVLVSAQNSLTETDGIDETDWVVSSAATMTDENGNYLLILEPGWYNLVAFAEGYSPECILWDAKPNDTLLADITLEQSSTGTTLTGGVTVIDGYPDQPVSISVRQILSCGSGDIWIEILSEQVANSGNYSFFLPEGVYRVVASSVGEETEAFTETLETDEIIRDIILGLEP